MNVNAGMVEGLFSLEQLSLEIMEGRRERGGNGDRIGGVAFDDMNLFAFPEASFFVKQQKAQHVIFLFRQRGEDDWRECERRGNKEAFGIIAEIGVKVEHCIGALRRKNR